MMELSELGNIPVDFSVLESMFPNHKSVHNKICEQEESGKIIRLKRGLYVVSPKVSGKLLSMELIANHIYGPSYVSMETALRHYGLIPETVYLTRSITTKHSRTFDNSLGRFEYIQCPNESFSIGIKQEINDNSAFLIASPEKALCDLIAYTAYLNLRSLKETITYLDEDIRFDMDALYKMNTEVFEQYAEVGIKKQTIANIIKLLKP